MKSSYKVVSTNIQSNIGNKDEPEIPDTQNQFISKGNPEYKKDEPPYLYLPFKKEDKNEGNNISNYPYFNRNKNEPKQEQTSTNFKTPILLNIKKLKPELLRYTSHFKKDFEESEEKSKSPQQLSRIQKLGEYVLKKANKDSKLSSKLEKNNIKIPNNLNQTYDISRLKKANGSKDTLTDESNSNTINPQFFSTLNKYNLKLRELEKMILRSPTIDDLHFNLNKMKEDLNKEKIKQESLIVDDIKITEAKIKTQLYGYIEDKWKNVNLLIEKNNMNETEIKSLLSNFSERLISIEKNIKKNNLDNSVNSYNSYNSKNSKNSSNSNSQENQSIIFSFSKTITNDVELIKKRLIDLESNLKKMNRGNSSLNFKEAKGEFHFNKVSSEIGDLKISLDKISNSLKSLQDSNENALAKIRNGPLISQNIKVDQNTFINTQQSQNRLNKLNKLATENFDSIFTNVITGNNLLIKSNFKCQSEIEQISVIKEKYEKIIKEEMENNSITIDSMNSKITQLTMLTEELMREIESDQLLIKELEAENKSLRIEAQNIAMEIIKDKDMEKELKQRQEKGKQEEKEKSKEKNVESSNNHFSMLFKKLKVYNLLFTKQLHELKQANMEMKINFQSNFNKAKKDLFGLANQIIRKASQDLNLKLISNTKSNSNLILDRKNEKPPFNDENESNLYKNNFHYNYNKNNNYNNKYKYKKSDCTLNDSLQELVLVEFSSIQLNIFPKEIKKQIFLTKKNYFGSLNFTSEINYINLNLQNFQQVSSESKSIQTQKVSNISFSKYIETDNLNLNTNMENSKRTCPPLNRKFESFINMNFFSNLLPISSVCDNFNLNLNLNSKIIENEKEKEFQYKKVSKDIQTQTQSEIEIKVTSDAKTESGIKKKADSFIDESKNVNNLIFKQVKDQYTSVENSNLYGLVNNYTQTISNKKVSQVCSLLCITILPDFKNLNKKDKDIIADKFNEDSQTDISSFKNSNKFSSTEHLVNYNNHSSSTENLIIMKEGFSQTKDNINFVNKKINLNISYTQGINIHECPLIYEEFHLQVNSEIIQTENEIEKEKKPIILLNQNTSTDHIIIYNDNYCQTDTNFNLLDKIIQANLSSISQKNQETITNENVLSKLNKGSEVNDNHYIQFQQYVLHKSNQVVQNLDNWSSKRKVIEKSDYSSQIQVLPILTDQYTITNSREPINKEIQTIIAKDVEKYTTTENLIILKKGFSQTKDIIKMKNKTRDMSFIQEINIHHCPVIYEEFHPQVNSEIIQTDKEIEKEPIVFLNQNTSTDQIIISNENYCQTEPNFSSLEKSIQANDSIISKTNQTTTTNENLLSKLNKYSEAFDCQYIQYQQFILHKSNKVVQNLDSCSTKRKTIEKSDYSSQILISPFLRDQNTLTNSQEQKHEANQTHIAKEVDKYTTTDNLIIFKEGYNQTKDFIKSKNIKRNFSLIQEINIHHCPVYSEEYHPRVNSEIIQTEIENKKELKNEIEKEKEPIFLLNQNTSTDHIIIFNDNYCQTDTNFNILDKTIQANLSSISKTNQETITNKNVLSKLNKSSEVNDYQYIQYQQYILHKSNKVVQNLDNWSSKRKVIEKSDYSFQIQIKPSLKDQNTLTNTQQTKHEEIQTPLAKEVEKYTTTENLILLKEGFSQTKDIIKMKKLNISFLQEINIHYCPVFTEEYHPQVNSEIIQTEIEKKEEKEKEKEIAKEPIVFLNQNTSTDNIIIYYENYCQTEPNLSLLDKSIQENLSSISKSNQETITTENLLSKLNKYSEVYDDQYIRYQQYVIHKSNILIQNLDNWSSKRKINEKIDYSSQIQISPTLKNQFTFTNSYEPKHEEIQTTLKQEVEKYTTTENLIRLSEGYSQTLNKDYKNISSEANIKIETVTKETMAKKPIKIKGNTQTESLVMKSQFTSTKNLLLTSNFNFQTNIKNNSNTIYNIHNVCATQVSIYPIKSKEEKKNIFLKYLTSYSTQTKSVGQNLKLDKTSSTNIILSNRCKLVITSNITSKVNIYRNTLRENKGFQAIIVSSDILLRKLGVNNISVVNSRRKLMDFSFNSNQIMGLNFIKLKNRIPEQFKEKANNKLLFINCFNDSISINYSRRSNNIENVNLKLNIFPLKHQQKWKEETLFTQSFSFNAQAKALVLENEKQIISNFRNNNIQNEMLTGKAQINKTRNKLDLHITNETTFAIGKNGKKSGNFHNDKDISLLKIEESERHINIVQNQFAITISKAELKRYKYLQDRKDLPDLKIQKLEGLSFFTEISKVKTNESLLREFNTINSIDIKLREEGKGEEEFYLKEGDGEEESKSHVSCEMLNNEGTSVLPLFVYNESSQNTPSLVHEIKIKNKQFDTDQEIDIKGISVKVLNPRVLLKKKMKKQRLEHFSEQKIKLFQEIEPDPGTKIKNKSATRYLRDSPSKVKKDILNEIVTQPVKNVSSECYKNHKRDINFKSQVFPYKTQNEDTVPVFSYYFDYSHTDFTKVNATNEENRNFSSSIPSQNLTVNKSQALKEVIKEEKEEKEKEKEKELKSKTNTKNNNNNSYNNNDKNISKFRKTSSTFPELIIENNRKESINQVTKKINKINEKYEKNEKNDKVKVQKQIMIIKNQDSINNNNSNKNNEVTKEFEKEKERQFIKEFVKEEIKVKKEIKKGKEKKFNIEKQHNKNQVIEETKKDKKKVRQKSNEIMKYFQYNPTTKPSIRINIFESKKDIDRYKNIQEKSFGDSENQICNSASLYVPIQSIQSNLKNDKNHLKNPQLIKKEINEENDEVKSISSFSDDSINQVSLNEPATIIAKPLPPSKFILEKEIDFSEDQIDIPEYHKKKK